VPAIPAWRHAASLVDHGPAGTRRIDLPDPSLVVLVGAAGAGKTTFARRHFAPAEVISSDALRAVVGAGEADQTATGTAFSILHRQVVSRLRRGLLTVVDATNLTSGARGSLLRRARWTGIPAVAIVFDLPGAVVLARNAARSERVVHPAIVTEHLARLRLLLDHGGVEGEGFVAVHRLVDPLELDNVSIERLSRENSNPPR
jgi:protein phosphatase